MIIELCLKFIELSGWNIYFCKCWSVLSVVWHLDWSSVTPKAAAHPGHRPRPSTNVFICAFKISKSINTGGKSYITAFYGLHFSLYKRGTWGEMWILVHCSRCTSRIGGRGRKGGEQVLHHQRRKQEKVVMLHDWVFCLASFTAGQFVPCVYSRDNG